jgi:hypothetical protein
MMVREIHGAKINPKPSLKNYGAQNTWGRKLRKQIQYIVFGISQSYVTAVGLVTYYQRIQGHYCTSKVMA